MVEEVYRVGAKKKKIRNATQKKENLTNASSQRGKSAKDQGKKSCVKKVLEVARLKESHRIKGVGQKSEWESGRHKTTN